MTDLRLPVTPVLPAVSAIERLRRFEAAVNDYSNTRTQLASLSCVIASQDGVPCDAQRTRLQELTAEMFMTGETLKALAMTLQADGVLTRCMALIRQHGEGLH